MMAMQLSLPLFTEPATQSVAQNPGGHDTAKARKRGQLARHLMPETPSKHEVKLYEPTQDGDMEILIDLLARVVARIAYEGNGGSERKAWA